MTVNHVGIINLLNRFNAWQKWRLAMPETLEERVGNLLTEAGLTLAVAESCTGGLIGHRITEVPGSSAYFRGDIVAYAYEAKERLLRVRHATLYEYGAVSEQTAIEMARGARRELGADIGIAVTGIAGPGGGLPDKPVGTTWVAVSMREGDWTRLHQWEGDRAHNKAESADATLQLLEDVLLEQA
jgi:PncC family amidohydrolase